MHLTKNKNGKFLTQNGSPVIYHRYNMRDCCCQGVEGANCEELPQTKTFQLAFSDGTQIEKEFSRYECAEDYGDLNCVAENELPATITLRVQGYYAPNKLFSGEMILNKGTVDATSVTYQNTTGKTISGIQFTGCSLKIDNSGVCAFEITAQGGYSESYDIDLDFSCDEGYINASSKYIDGATMYVDGLYREVSDSASGSSSESGTREQPAIWVNPDYDENGGGVPTSRMTTRNSITISLYGEDDCGFDFTDELVELQKKEVTNQKIVYEAENVEVGGRTVDLVTVTSDRADGGPEKFTIDIACRDGVCSGFGEANVENDCKEGYWVDPDSMEFGVSMNCDDCSDSGTISRRRARWFGGGGGGGRPPAGGDGPCHKCPRGVWRRCCKKRERKNPRGPNIPVWCKEAKDMPKNFEVEITFSLKDDCGTNGTTKLFTFEKLDGAMNPISYLGTCKHCTEDDKFGPVYIDFYVGGQVKARASGFGYYGANDFCDDKGAYSDDTVIIKGTRWIPEWWGNNWIEVPLCRDNYCNPSNVAPFALKIKCNQCKDMCCDTKTANICFINVQLNCKREETVNGVQKTVRYSYNGEIDNSTDVGYGVCSPIFDKTINLQDSEGRSFRIVATGNYDAQGYYINVQALKGSAGSLEIIASKSYNNFDDIANGKCPLGSFPCDWNGKLFILECNGEYDDDSDSEDCCVSSGSLPGTVSVEITNGSFCETSVSGRASLAFHSATPANPSIEEPAKSNYEGSASFADRTFEIALVARNDGTATLTMGSNEKGCTLSANRTTYTSDCSECEEGKFINPSKLDLTFDIGQLTVAEGECQECHNDTMISAADLTEVDFGDTGSVSVNVNWDAKPTDTKRIRISYERT